MDEKKYSARLTAAQINILLDNVGYGLRESRLKMHNCRKKAEAAESADEKQRLREDALYWEGKAAELESARGAIEEAFTNEE